MEQIILEIAKNSPIVAGWIYSIYSFNQSNRARDENHAEVLRDIYSKLGEIQGARDKAAK